MEWKRITEQKPTDSNQIYLCCEKGILGEPYFVILYWTNNGKSGCYQFEKEETFYKYDSVFGFIEIDGVLYWTEIDEPNMEEPSKSVNEDLGILGE